MRPVSTRVTAAQPFVVENKITRHGGHGPVREERQARQQGANSKQFGWVAKGIKTPPRPARENWFVQSPESKQAQRNKKLNALHLAWNRRNQDVNAILACRGHDKIAELKTPPGDVGTEPGHCTLSEVTVHAGHVGRHEQSLSIKAAGKPESPSHPAPKDQRFQNYLKRTKFFKPGEEIARPRQFTLEHDPSRGLGSASYGTDVPSIEVENRINDAVGRMAKCHFDLAFLLSPDDSLHSRDEVLQIESAVNGLFKSAGYDVTADTVNALLLAQLFARFKDVTRALAEQKTPKGRQLCIAEIRIIIDEAGKKLQSIGLAMVNADVHPSANALLKEYGQAILDMKDALESGPWKELGALAEEFEREEPRSGSEQSVRPPTKVANTNTSKALRCMDAGKLIVQVPCTKDVAIRAPLRGPRTPALSH